jgi:hypothetical protein
MIAKLRPGMHDEFLLSLCLVDADKGFGTHPMTWTELLRDTKGRPFRLIPRCVIVQPIVARRGLSMTLLLGANQNYHPTAINMVLCSALRPAQHFAAIAGWMSQSDWELHMATDNFVRAEARIGPMLIGTALSPAGRRAMAVRLPGGIMNGNNQRSSSTILCGQTLFQVCGSPGKAPSYAWCLCILTMRIWWTGPVLKEHPRHPFANSTTFSAPPSQWRNTSLCQPKDYSSA